MDQTILKNYVHTIEKIFSNIESRSIFDHIQPEITGDGLPFISECFRAEKLLLEEIELNGISDRERKFLLKFFDELERPKTSGYMDFALDEIYAGMEEMKERLSENGKTKPSRREVLTEAVKQSGGGLSVNKIHAIARTHGYNEKGMENLYYRIKDDLM